MKVLGGEVTMNPGQQKQKYYEATVATDKAGDIYMSVTRHVSTSPTFVDMGSRFYFRGISDHARQIPSVMSWAAAVMGTLTEV